MVHNPNYDLSRPLRTALNAKAPVVGIPIPGHAPLIFKRDFLRKALSGVKPVHVEVNLGEDDRYLIVHGISGPRCRTTMRARSLNRRTWDDRLLIDRLTKNWKPVDSKSKPRLRNGEGARQKALEKLRRQLANFGRPPRVGNPCTPSLDRVTDSERERFLSWRRQRNLRRMVSAIGHEVKSGKITSKEAYERLDALLECKAKRLSDCQGKHFERMGIDTFWGFFSPENLWKAQELSSQFGSRPHFYGGEVKWGPERYYERLNWSHEKQELLSQIAAIEAMG